MIRTIITNINYLRQQSSLVTTEDDFKSILTDLTDTLNTKKGYGLAAPQIGILKQIAVMRYNGQEIIIINPVIQDKSEKLFLPESCLSFPGISIIVNRYNIISFTSLLGSYELSGLTAQIAQHEIDHLSGITIFDRKHKSKR